MSGEPEVIVRVDGRVGRLTLNRPKALHALTLGMCETMIAALLVWRGDPAVAAVLIDHSGERGFCAGGDIRFLADSAGAGGEGARRFFFTEYQLNHLLFTFPKPVMAVMDGITMGGGVGISAPAKWRVATERTTFAMPETGIGLFPDVGGGWHLSRLPGATGMWAALTGARLKAADCLELGIANALVASADLEAFKAAVVAQPSEIGAAVAQFAGDAGLPPIRAHRREIDRHFDQPTLEAMVEHLRTETGWAAEQAAILATKSPLSLTVTLRELREGARAASFAEEMAREMRIAARMVQSEDFAEGVRAVIVEKDNAPRWRPARLADVTPPIIDAIFAPLPADQEWTPL